MKPEVRDQLEEAVMLFRENETMFGDIKQDKEKANLYRGLAALAEALMSLEQERSQCIAASR